MLIWKEQKKMLNRWFLKLFCLIIGLFVLPACTTTISYPPVVTLVVGKTPTAPPAVTPTATHLYVKATSSTIQIPLSPTITPTITPSSTPSPTTTPSPTITPSQEPTLTHTPPPPVLRLGYINRLNCEFISYIAKALLEEATDKRIDVVPYDEISQLYLGLYEKEIEGTLCYWFVQDQTNYGIDDPALRSQLAKHIRASNGHYLRNPDNQPAELSWVLVSTAGNAIPKLDDLPQQVELLIVDDQQVDLKFIEDAISNAFQKDLPEHAVNLVRASSTQLLTDGSQTEFVLLPQFHWLLKTHPEWRQVDLSNAPMIQRSLKQGRLQFAFTGQLEELPLADCISNLFIYQQDVQDIVYRVTEQKQSLQVVIPRNEESQGSWRNLSFRRFVIPRNENLRAL